MNHKAIYVKKTVSNTDYKKHYKESPGYCFLRKDKAGVVIAFMIADLIPFGCELLTDEELSQFNDYLDN